MTGVLRFEFRLRTVAALALWLAVPGAGIAESQTPDSVVTRRLEGAQESLSLSKTDRMLPLGADSKDVPILVTPQSERKDEPQPSGGLNVLERMGAELPPLPPEKTYAGEIDEAYGAFQRGLYLTAMNLALPKAQKGDPAAQTLVAELLNNGLGVKRNPQDAAFWYEQAARAGDPNAQFKFALMLLRGENVKPDRKLADEMMQKAAEGGNPEAQFNIAQIKVAATPGEKGLMEALPWYEKAAQAGIPDAQYAVAQLYINLPVEPEKKAKARDWMTKAAHARFDTALYDLGLWYINGIGGERDYEQGFEWLRRAANRGHVLAQNKLAHLYVNAIGTRPDPAEAAKWYLLSQKAGLPDAALDDFYLGIEEDTQKEAMRRAEDFQKRRR